jgi:MFS transporter, DHA1 family, inner membrane transport protein
MPVVEDSEPSFPDQDGLQKPPGTDDSPIRGPELILLLMLASVQFTSIVDFMVVMPLGPQLKRTLAITSSQFGLIVSSYTIAAGIAGIFASTFMDRFGRKTAFLTLYAGFLVGTFLCGLAGDYYTLLAARVATGAFGGILGGMALAIVGDVFPEHKRGRATGVLMSAFALASVVGVPVGIELGNRFDWHAPFVALAVLGLPVLVASIRVLPPLRDHLRHTAHAHPLARLIETFTHANHLRAFALVATMMLGGFAVIPYLSVYLVSNVGVRETDLPVIYVTGGLLTLFGAPIVGKFADRHGKLPVYRVVATISAVLMILVTNLPRLPVAFVAAATGTLMLTNAGRMVAAMAMVTGSVESQRRGGFMTANSAVQHISTGLGAFLGGRIIWDDPVDHSIHHFDWVGLIAVAATLVSLWLAGRVRPAAKPSPTPADVSAFESVIDDPLSAAETL